MPLTNVQIEEFMKTGLIKITPFDASRLDAIRYRLRVHSVRFMRFNPEDGLLDQGEVVLSNRAFSLGGREYAIISIAEQIVLVDLTTRIEGVPLAAIFDVL